MKLKSFSINIPQSKIMHNFAYYMPNRHSKRSAMFACPKGGQTCIINSLSGVDASDDASDDPSDFSNVNIVYSGTYCPFVIPSTIPTGVPPKNYEIVIYGKNKTSFTNCIPDTTLTVNCTGLFAGIFPGNQIDTTSFNSAAVNDVQIFTGETSGVPNPLGLVFVTDGYSNGVCTIQIEAQLYGESFTTTIDLIANGLTAIDWTWSPTYNSWYSMIEIQNPTQTTDSGYNVKLELNFTLNKSTSSNKNQTWMQMNAKLAYSSSKSCSASEEATVAGKMQSITALS